jgi:hypothetical protein
MIRRYSELIQLPTFKERFEYCNLNGVVGADTFGYLRFLNQSVYHGDRWKRLRNRIIDRDSACELAFPDYKIKRTVYLHHLNPLSPEEVEELADSIYDEENIVCVSLRMHNAIHYGNYEEVKPLEIVERRPFDTSPWRY